MSEIDQAIADSINKSPGPLIHDARAGVIINTTYMV